MVTYAALLSTLVVVDVEYPSKVGKGKKGERRNKEKEQAK